VSAASDDRIMDPEEEQEAAAQDRVETLEREERDEEHAEADFEEEVPAQAAGHYEQMMHVLGAVFRDEDVDLESIEELSIDERGALDALRKVVRGRDLTEDRILYAEERLGLLNQVLAVLQPTLAMALTPELAALRDEYDAVVEEVVELRDRLESLDSAQEEIFEQDRDKAAEAPDTDDDDKPDDEAAEPEPADPDAPRKSSLYGEPGEPAVEKKPAKSTLGDD
jgi:hypothetical protein